MLILVQFTISTHENILINEIWACLTDESIFHILFQSLVSESIKTLRCWRVAHNIPGRILPCREMFTPPDVLIQYLYILVIANLKWNNAKTGSQNYDLSLFLFSWLTVILSKYTTIICLFGTSTYWTYSIIFLELYMFFHKLKIL